MLQDGNGPVRLLPRSEKSRFGKTSFWRISAAWGLLTVTAYGCTSLRSKGEGTDEVVPISTIEDGDVAVEGEGVADGAAKDDHAVEASGETADSVNDSGNASEDSGSGLENADSGLEIDNGVEIAESVGEVQEEGPSPQLEVLFDAYGQPHIRAANLNKAAEGLGWAHAHLRLFQMAFSRLKVQGRLSEFLGRTFGENPQDLDNMIKSDRVMRTFGLWIKEAAVFAALPPEVRDFLNAYASGVNRYVDEELKGALPQPFQKIGLAFEPWTGVDCLVAFDSLAVLFTGGEGAELENLLRYLKDERALGKDLAIEKWQAGQDLVDDDGAIVPYASSAGWWDPGQGNGLSQHVPPNLKASQNYVVSGDCLAPENGEAPMPVMVGLPMLDPGSKAFVPAHVVTDDGINVSGAGVPGMPGFLLGYTGRTSWAVTALGADAADLRMLKPVGTHGYELDGQTAPYTPRVETILIREANGTLAEEKHPVLETVFGPVVDSQQDAGLMAELKVALANTANPNPSFALQHLVLARENNRSPAVGMLGMWKASNWSEFKSMALAEMPYPMMHLIFSSNATQSGLTPGGEIAYMPVTDIPMRKAAHPLAGLLPLDGTTTKEGWDGFIPMDERPELYNPPQCFIATANNMAVSSNYPYYGYGGVGHTHRSQQLNDRLGKLMAKHENQVPVAEVLELRMDSGLVVMDWLSELIALLRQNHSEMIAELDPAHPNHEVLMLALNAMDAWQGSMRTDLPYAGFFFNLDSAMVGRFRKTPMAITAFAGGQGGTAHFLREFHEAVDQESFLAPWLKDTVNWVFSGMAPQDGILVETWNGTSQPAGTGAGMKGYGADPALWVGTHQGGYVVDYRVMQYESNFTLPVSIDPQHEVTTGELVGIFGDTIRSQAGNIFTQVSRMGDVDRSETAFAVGISNVPDHAAFSNQLDEYEASAVHTTPLSWDLQLDACVSVPSTESTCRHVVW